MSIADSLEKVMRFRLVNAVKLAATSGVSASRISDILAGKTLNPRFETLSNLAKALEISVEELTSEEGILLADDYMETCRSAYGSGETIIRKDEIPNSDENPQQGCDLVNIYNMVSCGPGAEPEWHEPVDRRAIPVGFLRANIRPILVRGRSMEPTFKNGAIIGVDQSDKQVVEGEAYAVVLPYSGAAVKRLYPQPDGVLIRSDNKEFPEVKLKKEDVPEYFILGRVCWVVQEV
jgi:phage repressor protein C with HTH and peptisase S24 domain